MSTPFFWDSIPKELFGNILRYFSRIPNAKKWEAYVDVHDLTTAFGCGGDLGTFLKSRFHSLQISGTREYDNYRFRWMWGERSDPRLWTNDMAVARAFVLAGGGTSLRALYIGDGVHELDHRGEILVDDFLRHCPNVTSLSAVESRQTVWTNKFASQLISLEVIRCVPLTIPDHTSALCELSIETFQGNWDMLRRIGACLETLVVYKFIDYQEDVTDKIRLHCSRLKSISLKGWKHPEVAAVARLLASYGPQLEYAVLFLLDADQIRDVAAACPNARFRVYGNYSGGLSPSTLHLIGDILESAYVVERPEIINPNGDETEGGIDEWATAWNGCVNLHTLGNMGGLYAPQAVFSTPKPKIISIDLNFLCCKRKAVKKAMENKT